MNYKGYDALLETEIDTVDRAGLCHIGCDEQVVDASRHRDNFVLVIVIFLHYDWLPKLLEQSELLESVQALPLIVLRLI